MGDDDRRDEMTRSDYIALFQNATDAVGFETQVLSIGDALLPECARAVRDGGEPTAEYWAWLAEQAEAAASEEA
jgi:hypothetical protein